MLSNARAAPWTRRDRGLAPFEAEAREPAQRRALEPLRLGASNDAADRERVSEVKMRHIASRVPDEREVAALDGSLFGQLAGEIDLGEFRGALAAEAALGVLVALGVVGLVLQW
jgi:hypothetical protein